MKILYYLAFLIALSSNSYSHAARARLFIEPLSNDTMLIHVRLGTDGNYVIGIPLKLISLVSQSVIYEKNLTKEGLIIKIPDESYLITFKSKGKLIEKLGLAPKKGFTKKASKPVDYAYNITLLISLFFVLFSFILGFVKIRKFKEAKR